LHTPHNSFAKTALYQPGLTIRGKQAAQLRRPILERRRI
jgi:hypothetical protein